VSASMRRVITALMHVLEAIFSMGCGVSRKLGTVLTGGRVSPDGIRKLGMLQMSLSLFCVSDG
jgi:hypothetical protein